ncbi:hypothetical protein CI102_14526, partial [Trichoderma harzianum]
GPVCSPIDKPLTGRLVVEWVTISEHRLLYVFSFLVVMIISILFGIEVVRLLCCHVCNHGRRLAL